MGIYADFLSHTTVLDVTEPQVAQQRVAYNELARRKNRQDPDYESGFNTQNEVQIIGQFSGTVSSGNFTLTIVTPDGTSLTTANIAYNANAATIESAIDTVCTGNITSWTNGDIGVTLTNNLTVADATLTFSGDSVKEKNYGQTTITDVDLGGGGTVGSVSTTQHGQVKRYAWAIMQNLGMIASPPPQGDLVTEALLPKNSRWPSHAVKEILAWQAAIDDDNYALRAQLEQLFNV